MELEKLRINELRDLHDSKKSMIRERIEGFATILPKEYFYELIYCLLTPQSSAVNASRVVETLRENDFECEDLDPEPFLREKKSYIRFHKTKARYLLSAKEQYPLIASQLSPGASGTTLREWLVTNVAGYGFKEASHFLRNIGFRNLAILDRHILRNLVRVGVLSDTPKTLTPRRYLFVEDGFLAFSKQVGIPLDELDLLFWSMETGEILK